MPFKEGFNFIHLPYSNCGKCNFSSKLQRTLRKVRQNYNDLVFKEKQVKNNKNA